MTTPSNKKKHIDKLASAEQTPSQTTHHFSSRMVWILGYIGGLFVVVGFGIFLGENWELFTLLQRITITYGTGMLLFVLSCVLYFRRAAPAILHNLFIISAVLMSIGLGVIINDLFPEDTYLSLFILSISGTMLFQYLMTFFATRLISVLFMTLIFAVGTYASAIDVLHDFNLVPIFVTSEFFAYNLAYLVGALSLIGVTYVISQSQFRKIAGFWFFFSSVGFYYTTHMIFESDFEMMDAFILAILPGVYLAKIANSKALMVTTAIAFLPYLFHLDEKYFYHTTWWPLSLISMGLIIIAVAAYLTFKATRNK